MNIVGIGNRRRQKAGGQDGASSADVRSPSVQVHRNSSHFNAGEYRRRTQDPSDRLRSPLLREPAHSSVSTISLAAKEMGQCFQGPTAHYQSPSSEAISLLNFLIFAPS